MIIVNKHYSNKWAFEGGGGPKSTSKMTMQKLRYWDEIGFAQFDNMYLCMIAGNNIFLNISRQTLIFFDMRSYFRWFLACCGIVFTFELLFFFHIWADGYKFMNIDGYSVLTIWAAVLMLIFLVFSVLGLINVDSRI